LAEIAVALSQAVRQRALLRSAGCATPRLLAAGEGWRVADVICTSGPGDRPFEEQHSHVSIALVLAGTFQYRSRFGLELMTPGSAMLGNAGQCYECGHEHAVGDRCLSFWYAPAFFERLANDRGARDARFTRSRVPAIGALAPLIAHGAAALVRPFEAAWEEIALRVAAAALDLAGTPRRTHAPPPSAISQVTEAVRLIETRAHAPLPLGRLAKEAGLSPYHFLRTFERVTGMTPHQFVRRARLRAAAVRLTATPDKVVDIALDCGFGDVSNFNRAFRREFGVSPRVYRGSRLSAVSKQRNP
jgi:AraC family transcriptional regulator